MSKSSPIWQGAEPPEEISYLKEMVTHQASVGGALAALSAAALLSIPLGLGIGALPLLGFAAAEAIAALFVPSSPVFQESVNRRKRLARREKARQHLIDEIQRRLGDSAGGHWPAYNRMRQHLASLRQIAENRKTSLSQRDVERLDDATVDFLGLWLARLVMQDRQQSLDRGRVERQLRDIQSQLPNVAEPADRARLEKAAGDLERILLRRESLWSRATSVEAAMLSMVDTFEELYQRVVTNPTSGDVSVQLNDAVERMKVEEQLDLAVEAELADLFAPQRKAAAARRQAAG